MWNAIGSNGFMILAVLVFVAVLLLLEGGYMLWRTYKGPEARKIERRLQALSASFDDTGQAHLLKARMLSELPLLERLMQSIPRVHHLDRFIYQSNLDWTVSMVLLGGIVLAGLGYVATTMVARQDAWLGLLAALCCAALPLLYVQKRRARRMSQIGRQLPDALDLLTRALRAGHAFSSGLKMIGDEMPEPISGEFRIIHDEINFGISLQQALTNLSERLPITDVRYFVVAVLIQRDSGGNLTEILGKLSTLIRERMKLAVKVRVLSSEGRLSAWILACMPFALGGIIFVVNPEFMSPLWTDRLGVQFMKYTLAMMVVGIFVLRKLIRIRV
ncbi:type II secretion system F family protein [Herbaspirillum sp.]|uniref:type II secretion system F family protein n=1 Tax=Herbaspirillum sp. TaxID=1890675 RepID=UPI001B0A2D99|nr:type II secretion system F family protein [Herbaspirillum sp.]MBO9537646.1 type II secretion system F family protein [Herbaspirillum sp.]